MRDGKAKLNKGLYGGLSSKLPSMGLFPPATRQRDRLMSKEHEPLPERVRECVQKLLPKKTAVERSEVEGALIRAARRYDRYSSFKEEWRDYANRRKMLGNVLEASDATCEHIRKMDTMSREHIENRLGEGRLERMKSDLEMLAYEVRRLVEGLQSKGSPIDLA
jgi:hypothetical protein